MISFYTLSTILFIHLIADFVCQTEHMSKNKSKCNEALAHHILVYSTGIYVMAMLNSGSFKSFYVGILWVIVNAIAHFLTDWVTSRASSALYKEEKYHDFFVCIGIDQMVHYLTLFGTFIIFSQL